MKNLLLASSALLLAAAAPAFAQDPSAPTTDTSYAAPSPTSTFAGPRAEIFGGWDRVGTRTHFDDGTTSVTEHGHKNAYTAGALLGYDMPIGDTLVIGGFGSYALSSAKTCAATTTGGGCVKSGRQIEGGARVGVKMLGGKALVYGKGAYVNGRISAESTEDGIYGSGHTNRDGWRAGAGVEYALNQHAYVKAEYDYTRFKTFDAGDLGVTDTSLRFDRNQVLGGFGIRF